MARSFRPPKSESRSVADWRNLVSRLSERIYSTASEALGTPTLTDYAIWNDVSMENAVQKSTWSNILGLASQVKIKQIVFTEDTVARSTTSTSLVQITQSETEVTTTASDKVLLFLDAEVSHSLVNGQIVWNLTRDSTALATNDSRIYAHQAATHGQSHYVGKTFVDTPGAGTHSYFMAIRTLGGGTVYALARGLTAVVFSTDT